MRSDQCEFRYLAVMCTVVGASERAAVSAETGIVECDRSRRMAVEVVCGLNILIFLLQVLMCGIVESLTSWLLPHWRAESLKHRLGSTPHTNGISEQ